MEYRSDNNHHLRNITEEIEARLKEKGKYSFLSVEESKAINKIMGEYMIKAKREHIRKQILSRKKSMEIILSW